MPRRAPVFATSRLFAALVALMILCGASVAARPAAAATADHLMCGWKVAPRTQTVSIDPYLEGSGVSWQDVFAAFQPWNDLFLDQHGFPIFEPHYGNWWEADILIVANAWDRTWVDGLCRPGYVQRGNNHSVLFLGRADAWRNRDMLSHELGHTLGFADHGSATDATDGHIGFKPCGNYLGVMSYCTSAQSWFLRYDLSAIGLLTDSQLIAGYWLP